MRGHAGLLTPLLIACAVLVGLSPRGGAEKPTPEQVEFFEKRVRPVLVDHCYKCHSADAKKPKGGLLVDSRAALLKGGDNGPALVPGDLGKSRFIQAISYKDTDLQMPPKGKLPDAVLADLSTWVKHGAPWPGGQTSSAIKDEFDLQKRKKEHWAWQPVRSTTPPVVKANAWPRDAVDRFILTKLEAKELRPAPAADPATLLRRLAFDLIGLPPPPEDIERFVKECRADCQSARPAGRIANPPYDVVEQLVDRLLASPHFGERWGRHWLDLVRYGETRGHEFDPPLPNAYQYRDYVIRALNADVPYNQLVVEHLAGDLLSRPRVHPTLGFNESILGTGFWFLGEEVHSPVDIRADQADRYDNRIDVLTKTFLGLTVACARCHDHKFDAISTKDYYALFGFLESSSYRLVRFDTLEHNRAVAARLWKSRESNRLVTSRALGRTADATAERMADYLLAARLVLLERPPPEGRKLEHLAAAKKLDPHLLGQWLSLLKLAAKDANDPFHVWAKIADDPSASDPKRLAALLRPLQDQVRKRSAARNAAIQDSAVVIDYGRCNSEDWLPDELGYGPAPMRAGELNVKGNAGLPTLRAAEQSAAVFDRVWDGHRLAAGVENEPGALGQQVRAGRTIRTPAFTITSGKVHYLVRGTGLAYAAVSAHTMIQGPLHGQLVRDIKAGPDFQWMTHDLSAYKGHRAHVEFTAAENADFAVAMVVQGDRVPGRVGQARPAILRMLSHTPQTVESLAASYQQAFADLAKFLRESPPKNGSPALDSREAAGLMNWLLAHPELGGDAAAKLIQAARDWLTEELGVAGMIRRESHLAMALRDANGVDEHVFIRGSHKALGERVPRRNLEALSGASPLVVSRSSGRLELASQWTDPARNPFLARVLVNRVWHHLFGRGLVASVDNFGVLGELPSHPELLDYLADEFVRDGWSIKRLIRRLVLTNTYRMISQATDPVAEQADPENVLLHHMRLRRLQGEAIRDAMLAISGRLDPQPFGPSVPTFLTPFLEGRGRPGQSGPLDGAGRRSVYQAVRRNFLPSMMLAFDTPSPFSTMGRRTISNVPAQALILMNDPFVHEQAERWGRRVAAGSGSDEGKITGMYLSAFGRPPRMQELENCRAFLEEQEQLTVGAPRKWSDFAHALFNVKEFILVH